MMNILYSKKEYEYEYDNIIPAQGPQDMMTCLGEERVKPDEKH